MKRIVSLLVALTVLMSFLCGCQISDAQSDIESSISDESSVPTHSSENTESSDDQNNDDTIQTDETLTDRYIREIDGAYSEEAKLPEYGTTVGMIELADKYAAKWKQVADDYYNKIMEYDGIEQLSEDYSSDDLHTIVRNMKTNWDEYSEEQSGNYRQTLFAIYSGGTISGPIFAHYKYEMQMEWALQILDICQQLHIE